jgi:hypothetical protein
MVVIEHYDLGSLAVRKLRIREADETWTFVTPIPWSQSNLPDLELVSETEFIEEPGGDRWFRWVLRHKASEQQV